MNRPLFLRRRALPLLVSAAVVCTALPASVAAPAAAAPSASHESTSHHSAPHHSASHHSGQHLTAAARHAGLEPGNATMGWRNAQTRAVSPSGPTLTTSKTFTPSGILGMDVASYQGKVKWTKWAGRGRGFAFVKATEGSTYRNPYFASQYGGSAKAGMLHGAYHFANPAGKSGTKQARYFVANGGGWTDDGQTLPGVLDIEYNPYGSTCYGISKKNMIKWVSDFTVEYKKLTTRDALIYTTTDWWTRCTGNTKAFSATNPLWAARYGTKTVGTLPAGWASATFWQYTSTPFDQDVFSASKDELAAFAGAPAVG